MDDFFGKSKVVITLGHATTVPTAIWGRYLLELSVYDPMCESGAKAQPASDMNYFHYVGMDVPGSGKYEVDTSTT